MNFCSVFTQRMRGGREEIGKTWIEPMTNLPFDPIEVYTERYPRLMPFLAAVVTLPAAWVFAVLLLSI